MLSSQSWSCRNYTNISTWIENARNESFSKNNCKKQHPHRKRIESFGIRQVLLTKLINPSCNLLLTNVVGSQVRNKRIHGFAIQCCISVRGSCTHKQETGLELFQTSLEPACWTVSFQERGIRFEHWLVVDLGIAKLRHTKIKVDPYNRISLSPYKKEFILLQMKLMLQINTLIR